jgi:hypothetical protein
LYKKILVVFFITVKVVQSVVSVVPPSEQHTVARLRFLYASIDHIPDLGSVSLPEDGVIVVWNNNNNNKPAAIYEKKIKRTWKVLFFH